MQSPQPPTGDGWWGWWQVFRQVVTFLLGCTVILDSLIEKNTATIGKLVIGLLLIGVPSIEEIARLTRRRG